MNCTTTNGNGHGLHLHKDHAIIHTASVDVKLIRLNKRQMTLSVFRQLDEESIFSADGSLRGIPWGRVNYTWKENKPGTDYHIVWQDGEYLKRCPIPRVDKEDRLREYKIQWMFGSFPAYPNEPRRDRRTEECLDMLKRIADKHDSLSDKPCKLKDLEFNIDSFYPNKEEEDYYQPEPVRALCESGLYEVVRSKGIFSRLPKYRVAIHIRLVPNSQMWNLLIDDRTPERGEIETWSDVREYYIGSLALANDIVDKAYDVVDSFLQEDPAWARYRCDQSSWDRRYKEAEDRFVGNVKSMKQLDQLFIAV